VVSTSGIVRTATIAVADAGIITIAIIFMGFETTPIGAGVHNIRHKHCLKCRGRGVPRRAGNNRGLGWKRQGVHRNGAWIERHPVSRIHWGSEDGLGGRVEARGRGVDSPESRSLRG